MKKLLTLPLLISSCLVYSYSGGHIDTPEPLRGNNTDQVIHHQEIYKVVDTFNLRVDIFYTERSMEKDNNTAIVFFHGGGWAYGTPSEFFSTCERYAGMGIIAFSVDYRLSIDHGEVPNKNISPIESLMDARSAMRWVRKNAGKYHISTTKIVAAGHFND
jgi:acetyl esterase